MSLDRTRIVRLDAGQQREDAENTKTGVLLIDRPRIGRSFELLFKENYDHVRKVVTAFRQPGVAVVAFDFERGRPSGSLCVAAYPTRANSAIVGRHSIADLYLDADPTLSLRHMVLVVDPLSRMVSGSGDLRFRLIDLRTRAAFEDERGRRMEALAAEGPIFVRCGNYALFCLPTGDGQEWPASAEEGWQCIPERVYLEESSAEPDRWLRQKRPREAPAEDARLQKITHVQRGRGPARARRNLLAEGEQPLGTLDIYTENATQKLVIGATAARRGVLLGRYDRCDSNEETLLSDPNISRVHLLLLGIGGDIYAIDTASTNGTYVFRGSERPWAEGSALEPGAAESADWEEVRILPLAAGTELCLGEELARLAWRPAEHLPG
jgi:hypothetical protein